MPWFAAARTLVAGMVLGGVLLALLAASPASAQVLGLRDGRLAHLFPYMGTLEHEAVLSDPVVSGAIARLMGPAAELLRYHMRVSGWIDLVEGTLILNGRAPHPASERQAASVLVEIPGGNVAVVLKHDGAVTVFSDPGNPILSTQGFHDTV